MSAIPTDIDALKILMASWRARRASLELEKQKIQVRIEESAKHVEELEMVYDRIKEEQKKTMQRLATQALSRASDRLSESSRNAFPDGPVPMGG